MKNKYDIIVVGAGPAGSTAARYAAKGGASVLLLEKDKEIGWPVRCGEAVSKKGIEEFLTPQNKFIATEIYNFSMISPEGKEVIIPLEETGLILERKIFDYELANLAANEGCEILTRVYVKGLLFDNDKVSGVKCDYLGEEKEIKADIVIGADGVESRVGRWANLKTYIDFRDMESGIQYTAANIPVDQNTCYFYFGNNIAPEGYLWIFPKGNNKANIGLGVSGIVGKKKSALSYLNDFMKQNYPSAPILTTTTGGIPCTPTLKKISVPGLILVGDAARQVNPLSGGGIVSGMIGGKIGGKIAAESIKNQNPDHLLTYDSAWKERLGKRHEIFNRIKEGIYNFSDDKFNSIARSALKIPKDKIGLANLFRTALFNNPSLLIDIAKVFVGK